jgi:DivIVA domain-containing protein
VDRVEDTHDIRNRTFSFGAHGYNQDDVDRYLRELADRLEAGDPDWDAEIERFRRRSFAVVSLGYWRPDVDAYMAELGEWMSTRAADEPLEDPAQDVSEGPEGMPEPEAQAAPTAAVPSGWTEGIVERLRRVTEASTAPTTLAGAAAEETAVPEIVAAAPLRLADDVEEEPEAGTDDDAPEPLDRARLFRMAIALGVEDAVSMTAAELLAAIDRAEGREKPEAAVAPAVRGGDPNAALLRTKATLASFERMLADQVSQVTAAARREREAAARQAEEIVRDAERRAGEILAAAEREGDALGERAQRYSERVRRLADREALRRAGAAHQAEASKPEAMPEPEFAPAESDAAGEAPAEEPQA